MAMPGEIGWIGRSCPQHPHTALATQIMRSAGGYFIATQCPACALEDPSPHSRESDYYASAEELREAWDTERVRWRDTRYRPAPYTVLAG